MQEVAHGTRRLVADSLFFGQGGDRFSDEDSSSNNGLSDSKNILTLLEYVKYTMRHFHQVSESGEPDHLAEEVIPIHALLSVQLTTSQ